MRPKLKENPREWLKFTLSVSAALAILATLLWKRNVLSAHGLILVLALLSLIVVSALAKPAWFRPLYRVGMTVSFYIGQVIGRILLALFFVLVLTPFGFLLRMTGKDMLKLKRNGNVTSYWQKAKKPGGLDRQF